MGLPIVAPDVGGVGEFVKNAETGILIPSSSYEEMAMAYVKAINHLADDPEIRFDLAANAYDRVIKIHSTGPYVQSLKRALELIWLLNVYTLAKVQCPITPCIPPTISHAIIICARLA